MVPKPFPPLMVSADVRSTEMAIIGRHYLLINTSPEEFEHWQESLCIPQVLPNALVRFFLDGITGNYTWGQEKLNYLDGSQFAWPNESGQKTR